MNFFNTFIWGTLTGQDELNLLWRVAARVQLFTDLKIARINLSTIWVDRNPALEKKIRWGAQDRGAQIITRYYPPITTVHHPQYMTVSSSHRPVLTTTRFSRSAEHTAVKRHIINKKKQEQRRKESMFSFTHIFFFFFVVLILNAK